MSIIVNFELSYEAIEMKDADERTIRSFAKRKDSTVMLITLGFALAGALLAIFTEGKGIWGMWIPLCFMTIPPIHYLCRQVSKLSARIQELETQLSHNKAIHADQKSAGADSGR